MSSVGAPEQGIAAAEADGSVEVERLLPSPADAPDVAADRGGIVTVDVAETALSGAPDDGGAELFVDGWPAGVSASRAAGGAPTRFTLAADAREASLLAAVLAGGYEWTTRPTADRTHHFFNGSVQWNVTTASSIRFFIGGNRGGLRCISGICRDFPAFSGARLEVVDVGRADRSVLALEILGVVLLIALAVFLRVYQLRQMPPGVFVDETNAALDAIRLMEGRPDSPFGTGWFETPTLYAFYLVGLFKLLGTSFVALKAASLIPAILTVVVMYPLARLMFGIPTAFAATFILATSRWHITMSRWGWNEVAPLLFMIVALYFLQRAVRDRRASDFALGGLFIGLGHYTYLASRLVVVTVVLYLLYRLIFERGFFKRNWRGLTIFLLLYLVAFAPLVVTYVRNPFTFGNRSQQVSILNDMQSYYLEQRAPAPKLVGQAMRAVGLPKEISLLPLQESFLRHAEMFHAFGDRNPRHNLPGAPMVDPITGGLLVLGLGFGLLQVLRPNASKTGEPRSFVPGISGGHRYALILLWLVVPLLGGVLSRLDEAPQAYRTLPALGAIALLAGDAAVRSARVFASALAGSERTKGNRWLQAAPAVAIAGLLLWSGTVNYRSVSYTHLTLPTSDLV